MEAIGSGMELQQVLYALAEVVVEATGAERAAIFLLRAGELEPRAVAARRVNLDLFRRFREMAPLDVLMLPGMSELLAQDEPVAIEDAASSGLVPPAWIREFGTTSLVVAPLCDLDGPLGIVAADFRQHHAFSPEEVALAKTIARAAAIAIGNARLHDRLLRTNQIQQELLASMSLVASATGLDEVLQTITHGVASLFRHHTCSIVLDTQTSPVRTQAMVQSAGPCLSTVFPLRTTSLHGHLILEGPTTLDAAEMELIDGFAAQAGAALEKAALHASLRLRLRRTDALYRLWEAMGGFTDLDSTLARINAEVCGDTQVACVDVALRDPQLASVLGCRAMSKGELSMLARLEVNPSWLIDQGGDAATHAFPIRSSNRLVGFLTARAGASPRLDPDDADLVAAIAGCIGELAGRARSQEAVRKTRGSLEVASAQARTAGEMTDAIRGAMTAVWRRLGTAASASTKDGRDRELAEARAEVARAFLAVRSIESSQSHLALRGRSFSAAMRELVASFAAETGTAASFYQRGAPVALPGRVAAGLYSLVFDVLTTVQRGSRASALVVALSEDKDSITLSIRDDGTSLSQRDDGGPWPGVHHGMRIVRDRAAALGATVDFAPAKPRGIEVLVRLPVAALDLREGPVAQAPAPRRRPTRVGGATISRIG